MELATLNYGDITTQGQSLLFSLTKLPPLPPVGWEVDTVSVTSGGNVTPSVSPLPPPSNIFTPNLCSSGGKWGQSGGNVAPTPKSLPDMDLNPSGGNGGNFSLSAETTQPSMLSCTTEPAEFVEQIKKAIANFDRSLAIQVWDGLKAKVKRKLREEVKNHLTPTENENFKLLVAAGFLRGTRVKYVGNPKYAEQYEGLELEVYSIDEHSLITCRKPDGYLTTRMKPEELEKL